MTVKDEVLKKLKQQTAFVSGEALAQELNVSRTAVWKAIKELEKAGYHIEHRSVGYRYLSSDVLDQAELIKKITTPLAVEVFETSVSTMKDAQLAALENRSTPRLFVADMQQAPHGRFNRPFFALPRAGIYMSLLIRPQAELTALPQYTILMAVALAEAIDHLTGLTTSIKWVNDIYLNGKKIAGILSEATTDVEANRLNYIIIGMGINFSIPQTAYPAALQTKATSIFPTGEATITRNDLIAEIWNRFFELVTVDPAFALTRYRQKSFVLGKKVTFQQKGQTFFGTAIAITEHGELVVDLGSEQKVLASGEISLSAIQ